MLTNKKPETITELLAMPFHDAEFVRFLKEENVYSLVRKYMARTPNWYHEQTLTECLSFFFTDRDYLIRLFIWPSGEETDWYLLSDKWKSQRNKNRQQ